MGSVEQVLVFPRNIAPSFTGVRAYGSRLWEQILKNAIFIDRDKAEASQSYKQIIPYSLLQVGDRFLSYRRTKKGKEGRLKGLRSVGIGGHINPIDGEFEDVVLASLVREFEEEIGLSITKDVVSLVGFINDDTNPVGFVHFGVFFLVQAQEFDLDRTAEDSIADLELVRPEDVLSKAEEYETWSVLAMEFLVSSLMQEGL